MHFNCNNTLDLFAMILSFHLLHNKETNVLTLQLSQLRGIENADNALQLD